MAYLAQPRTGKVLDLPGGGDPAAHPLVERSEVGQWAGHLTDQRQASRFFAKGLAQSARDRDQAQEVENLQWIERNVGDPQLGQGGLRIRQVVKV